MGIALLTAAVIGVARSMVMLGYKMGVRTCRSILMALVVMPAAAAMLMTVIVAVTMFVLMLMPVVMAMFMFMLVPVAVSMFMPVTVFVFMLKTVVRHSNSLLSVLSAGPSCQTVIIAVAFY